MTRQRDAKTGRFKPVTALSKEYLEQEYISNKKSADTIGAEHGWSGTAILHLLARYDIARRKAGTWRQDCGRDLTNQRFGKLVVKCRRKGDAWVTTCDCGNEYVARGHNLVRGHVSQCRNCSCPRLGYQDIPQVAWRQIVRGAVKRNLTFSITIAGAFALFQSQHYKCALTGVPIGFAATRKGHNIRRETTASLDRIDSTRGYEPDNIQWVHKVVQIMKGKLLQDEFTQWCRLVAKTHQ